MDIRGNYFSERLKSLSNQDSRQSFAERELSTIEFLGSLLGLEPFRKEGIAIDLGCGDQFLKIGIEDRGMKYRGLDIEDCDFERDRLPNLESESIDLVIGYSVIEHLKDPSNLLNEVRRVLNDDGLLVLEAPNWYFSYKNYFDDYTHVRAYTPGSLTNLLKDSGFQVLMDVPNLRCKGKFAYLNPWRYRLASLRPFTGSSPLVPNCFTGRAKGMIVVARKSL